MKAHDTIEWGKATTDCFAAQLEMYPAMSTSEVQAAIDQYHDQAYGWKLTGAGGGGYLQFQQINGVLTLN